MTDVTNPVTNPVTNDLTDDEQLDDRAYLVVRNDEEQYSVWWADRDLPAGWYAEGTEGSRAECLARIGEIWTDMRPLSLRRRMAAQADRS